jgi:hypothetical protein
LSVSLCFFQCRFSGRMVRVRGLGVSGLGIGLGLGSSCSPPVR